MKDESGQTKLITIFDGVVRLTDAYFLPGFGIWQESHGPIMFKI